MEWSHYVVSVINIVISRDLHPSHQGRRSFLPLPSRLLVSLTVYNRPSALLGQ